MAEDANMTQADNLVNGQAISVDYLIEKAVETAVNKALVKVDEFVHQAAQKVDRAAEKAFNEAFAKFSKRFNELQSSLPIEQNQQEALDGEQPAAAAQTVINELEESAQETIKIEETANISTWNAAEKDAALQTAINDPEEPAQETMEIEEAMDVSLQDVEEDEDQDNSEDSSKNEYNRPWEYPLPGSTYAIQMYHGSTMVADEDSGLVTRITLNPKQGEIKNKRFHWLCEEGVNGSRYFRNVATGKYLGADPCQSYKRLPVLTATSGVGENTRFHLRELYPDGFRLQVLVGGRFYYVTGSNYYDRKSNIVFDVICRKMLDKSRTTWFFRKIVE